MNVSQTQQLKLEKGGVVMKYALVNWVSYVWPSRQSQRQWVLLHRWTAFLLWESLIHQHHPLRSFCLFSSCAQHGGSPFTRFRLAVVVVVVVVVTWLANSPTGTGPSNVPLYTHNLLYNVHIIHTHIHPPTHRPTYSLLSHSPISSG